MAAKKFGWGDQDDAPSASDGSGGLFGRLRSAPKADKPPVLPRLNTRDASLLLQNFEESGRGWFWSTNAQGNLTYLSASVCATLGKDLSELAGSPLVELFYPPLPGNDQQRTLQFILTKQTKFDDLPLQARCMGDEVWWAVSGRAYHDSAGNFSGYRGSGTDITSQRQSAQDNNRLATYDSLTGLLNRFRMSKLLDSTLSAFASQKRACAVMLIDLDRFKQVNDTLGHPAGDALLKQVAERLIKVVGDREKVCRLGGDEFQIILQDNEDRGALGDLAGEIIYSLSQPYFIDGSRCIIGASIGIAISPFDGRSSEDLIRNADLALYAAKGSGRGRFRFYSAELLQTAEDRRVLEEDLRDALAKGEIHMAYQPVVSAKSNTVTGFEALIRWNHPERGPISPAVFIPIAEDAELIAELGEWAINQACKDAVTWPAKLKVAVNVSPVQFADIGLPKIVKNALVESGLARERLELEITESVFLQESSDTNAMFTALKKVGVRLALDDFGTGYSSLSYLKTAPFDKIKIDQSFVRGATEPGSRNKAIIAAIVALADALDMETTAEGIESLDQLALVRSLNVSHIQGYVYSKPVSTEVLLEKCEGSDWQIEPSGPPKQRGDRQSMFKKVNAIHDNHSYAVMVKNMSVSGALIEGILDVPVGTRFVIDFGEGQLAIATVRRSMDHQQGIEFDERLVSDGNGGLCTNRRISPYMLAAVAMPGQNVPQGFYLAADGEMRPKGMPSFATVNDWKAA
jgi:diguanylate cyclase (GGDEF)-like protein/PAS domain S-box-containing protein